MGASEGWFFLAKRAHLFRRRSQWEAVLLISLGQTLACVKCLQNQHWRGPRALVDICVCSSVRIYTHAQTLLYHLTCVFVCRKTVGKSPLYEKHAVHLRPSVCPDRYQFISCLFPAGSRVSTELQYTREKQGEETVFTSQMLIQTPKKEGTNILTQEALLVHMEAALSASKVQVSLFGK